MLYTILSPNHLLRTESPRAPLTAEARSEVPCEVGRLSSAALGTRTSPVQRPAPGAVTSPSGTHRNLSGAVEPAGPMGGALRPGSGERRALLHTSAAWPQALEAAWVAASPRRVSQSLSTGGGTHKAPSPTDPGRLGRPGPAGAGAPTGHSTPCWATFQGKCRPFPSTQAVGARWESGDAWRPGS